MVCEMENPGGYLSVLCQLVFYLGSLSYLPCGQDVFLSKWSTVARLEGQYPTDRLANLSHRWNDRETPDPSPLGDKVPLILSACIFKDVRNWVRDRKATRGTEKTHAGHRRELFQPAHNHYPFAHRNTTNEDIETIHNNDGVELGRYCNRRKVFQG